MFWGEFRYFYGVLRPKPAQPVFATRQSSVFIMSSSFFIVGPVFACSVRVLYFCDRLVFSEFIARVTHWQKLYGQYVEVSIHIDLLVGIPRYLRCCTDWSEFRGFFLWISLFRRCVAPETGSAFFRHKTIQHFHHELFIFIVVTVFACSVSVLYFCYRFLFSEFIARVTQLQKLHGEYVEVSVHIDLLVRSCLSRVKLSVASEVFCREWSCFSCVILFVFLLRARI